MSHIQQIGSAPSHTQKALRVKHPISERKLRANRANAKRSTGPRTEAGKAVSRCNALKHGLLSHSIHLPAVIARVDPGWVTHDGSLLFGDLRTESATLEMIRIWEKMARVLALEKDCLKSPDGLKQNGRLIHRYERMLSTQLHARIRELAGLAAKSQKNGGRSL